MERNDEEGSIKLTQLGLAKCILDIMHIDNLPKRKPLLLQRLCPWIKMEKWQIDLTIMQV